MNYGMDWEPKVLDLVGLQGSDREEGDDEASVGDKGQQRRKLGP